MWLIPAIHWWRFSGILSKSRTKSTKLATSTIVDHTCFCAWTKARWRSANRVCVNDSMDGLSPGPDLTAWAEYSIRRLGTRHQCGRTCATSESSPTLFSGRCEGQPRSRDRAAQGLHVALSDDNQRSSTCRLFGGKLDPA